MDIKEEHNEFFHELDGRGFIFQNKKWLGGCFEDDQLQVVWEMWQAKAQAVPEGFKVVSFKQISELVVAVNKVDLMTHTEQKTNEARLAWQDIASKLQTMIEAQEPTND